MNVSTFNRQSTTRVAGVADRAIRLKWFGQAERYAMGCLLFLALVCLVQRPALAQCSGPNLLTNPSFESPVVPAGQNNLVNSIAGWINRTGSPVTQANLYRPSGTETQVPAAAANGSQYVDLQGGLGVMDQVFTLTTASAIAFSGQFSNRVSSVGGSGYVGGQAFVQILDATASYEVAISSIVILNSALGDQTWVTASGISSVLPAGSYTFRFAARTDFANFDNMSVCAATNAATSCANRTVLKPQPGWSATASSNFPGYLPSEAIDGSLVDNATNQNVWATATTNAAGQFITFDYGTPLNLVGFIYYPRTLSAQDIRGYTVQSSSDGVNFTTIQTGSIAQQNTEGVSGSNKLVGNPLEVDFITGVTARYMRLIVNDTYQGLNASIAELLPIVCTPPTLNVISCANADLLNTGTNNTGTGLATQDRFDANWEVAWITNSGGYGNPIPFSSIATSTFVPAIVTGNKAPGAWANSPFGNANWISYTETSFDANAETATSQNSYFFRYRFTITDPYLLPAFKLTLNFLSDNQTQNIFINGVGQAPQFGLPGGGFFLSNQTQTVLKNGWQLGQNEVIIQVYSQPGYAGFLGQNITSCPGLDFGDAPTSYNVSRTTFGAGHIVETDPNDVVTLKLGNLIDSEADGVASVTATSDNASNFNDEDGIASFPVIQGTNNLNLTNYTVNVALHNGTGATATLCGWIDWNNNGTFDASEAACMTVSNGATSAQLVWPSATLTGVTGSTTGTFARFRITTDALASNSANGAASNGEVEDYFIPFCVIAAPTATLVTPATICSGAPVTINYTTNPTGQLVQWIRMPGGVTGANSFTDFPQANGTTPVSYTYSAWISNAAGSCSSQTVTTGVTVNPKPQITPSLCSQTICSGQTGAITFTSNIPGETIHWLRTPTTPAPSSGTGNIGQSFTNTGPASLTYTYTIWADYAGTVSCATSNTITCTIVVDVCTPTCDLVATAIPSSVTSCLSPNTGSIAITYTGSQTYQYTLNGGSPQALGASPFTINGLASGQYIVVVQAVSDPTCIQSLTTTVSSPTPLTLTASSNSPICSGDNLQLQASVTPSGFDNTYSWTGPGGFVSTTQNPLIMSGAVAGTYTVTVTTPGGCSATNSTSVIVTAGPSLTLATSSLTICSGQSGTIAVGGDNGATVTWQSTWGHSGTGTTINLGTLVNNGSVPYTIPVSITASAGSCVDTEIAYITVKPAPLVFVVPSNVVVCSLENVTLSATSSMPGATINWTRTPNTPDPPASSGTIVGTTPITQALPAGTYTYTFTGTINGCTGPQVSVQAGVNN